MSNAETPFLAAFNGAKLVALERAQGIRGARLLAVVPNTTKSTLYVAKAYILLRGKIIEWNL